MKKIFFILLQIISFLPIAIIILILYVLISKTINYLPNFENLNWLIQHLFFNSLFYSISSVLFAFPLSLFFAIYLLNLKKNIFYKSLLYLLDFFSLLPSIIFVVVSVFIIIPLLKFFGINNSFFAVVFSFSFLIIPILTNKIFILLKNLSLNFKESIYSLGINQFESYFYVIIPMLKYELFSIFLMGISIVFGDALIFIFIVNLFDDFYFTFSEYIGRNLLSKDISEISFIFSFILFLMINFIGLIRGLIRKENE